MRGIVKIKENKYFKSVKGNCRFSLPSIMGWGIVIIIICKRVVKLLMLIKRNYI